MQESDETSPSEGCCDWPKSVNELNERAQQFVRNDPSKAVGVALVAGLLLTIFPVGKVFGALVRLVFALARPLLLALGALKVYEEIEKKRTL